MNNAKNALDSSFIVHPSSFHRRIDMPRKLLWNLLVGAGCVLGWQAGKSLAQEPPAAPAAACPAAPAAEVPAKPPEEEFHREEHYRPHNIPGVACYAQPSFGPHDVGYYVGGGCLHWGEYRDPAVGTWGWDYEGCIPKCIILRWCHKYQGGTGSYKTDGPKLPHH